MLINEYIRIIQVKKPKGRQLHSTSSSIAEVKINSRLPPNIHKTREARGGGGGGGAGIKNKGIIWKLWCLNRNNRNDC